MGLVLHSGGTDWVGTNPDQPVATDAATNAAVRQEFHRAMAVGDDVSTAVLAPPRKRSGEPGSGDRHLTSWGAVVGRDVLRDCEPAVGAYLDC